MMKKIILCLILILSLIGCEKKEAEKEEKKEEQNNEVIPIVTDTYTDDNDTILGLYLYKNSYTNRKLVTTYETNFVPLTDIVSLEVFSSLDSEISGANFSDVFKSYYDLNSKYKIGFEVSFEVGDETYRKTILKPDNFFGIYRFIQIYLYDDVHQPPNTFYSHIEDNEYDDNTLLTSIKLTASTDINMVTSDIMVTVFSYDNDDFDDEGYYRGNSKYQVIIKNANLS